MRPRWKATAATIAVVLAGAPLCGCDAVDRCLDQGGRWDEARERCSFEPKAGPDSLSAQDSADTLDLPAQLSP
jgi:hypothetical protein